MLKETKKTQFPKPKAFFSVPWNNDLSHCIFSLLYLQLLSCISILYYMCAYQPRKNIYKKQQQKPKKWNKKPLKKHDFYNDFLLCSNSVCLLVVTTFWKFTYNLQYFVPALNAKNTLTFKNIVMYSMKNITLRIFP